jgi:DNA-binding LytR/AlgR family response regulator
VRIIIEDPLDGEEDTITISVRCMSEKIAKAIDILKHPDDLTVYLDKQAFLLPVSEVFYIESVDLKSFVYAKGNVYLSKLKLYELEKSLNQSEFLRISKQMIVNLRKIQSISPAGGGRFEALLLNGEKIIVSRQYVPRLKERFGL